MRSVEKRFNKIINRCTGWSTLTCFYMAINCQGFEGKTIRYWFNKLVDKDDYPKELKRAILRNCYSFTKPLEEGKK